MQLTSAAQSMFAYPDVSPLKRTITATGYSAFGDFFEAFSPLGFDSLTDSFFGVASLLAFESDLPPSSELLELPSEFFLSDEADFLYESLR